MVSPKGQEWRASVALPCGKTAASCGWCPRALSFPESPKGTHLYYLGVSLDLRPPRLSYLAKVLSPDPEGYRGRGLQRSQSLA